MEVADQRRGDAGVEHAPLDLGNRGRGLGQVDRDADHLGSRLGQLDALLGRAGGIRGVGHRHRLDDDRRTAADLDAADANADRPVNLQYRHGSFDSTSRPDEPAYQSSDSELGWRRFCRVLLGSPVEGP